MWLLIALHASLSFASLDEAYLRKLARAESARQVRKLSENYEQLRILRRACRLQIETSAIPTACYETHSQERKWGLNSLNPELLARLDEICARNARSWQGARYPKLSPFLSYRCRKEIREAEKIRKYRQMGANLPGF